MFLFTWNSYSMDLHDKNSTSGEFIRIKWQLRKIYYLLQQLTGN